MAYVERIARIAVNSDITLVYAARDSEHNNAIVPEELIVSPIKDLLQA